MRKVVRRGKGSGEEGVQEVSMEGSLQDANELEVDAEQFMSYAILGRDSSKVGLWSADSSLSACEALQHLRESDQTRKLSNIHVAASLAWTGDSWK